MRYFLLGMQDSWIDPEAFHIGGRAIYWYGIFVALGFLAATVHWNRLASRTGRPRGFGSDFAFLVMITGILGARAGYIIANWKDYAVDPLSMLRVDQGGLIFYGGFVTACLAVVVWARLRREPLWSLADYGITGVPLGHALGRIGCFLNGCCYGSPCELPWSTFSAGAMRHPVQVYEAVTNLGVYALLLWFFPRARHPGRVLALYLLVYPPWRFLSEFFRGDTRLHWLGLNVAQEISLALFAAGSLLWWLTGRASTERAR